MSVLARVFAGVILALSLALPAAAVQPRGSAGWTTDGWTNFSGTLYHGSAKIDLGGFGLLMTRVIGGRSTVAKGARPGLSVCPIGSRSFQNVLTSVSLTITTGPDAASLGWNDRPFTIGMPIVSK